MTLIRRVAPAAPHAATLVVFALLPLVGMIWPNLAQAVSVARPDDPASVVLDGLLCFGPLALPLVGVGAVVVWTEQKG